MPTGIVEGPDLAIGAAHDDNRIGANVMDNVIASFRDLAGRQNKQPLLVPDPRHIGLEDTRVAIKILRKGIRRFPTHQRGQNIGFAKHEAPI